MLESCICLLFQVAIEVEQEEDEGGTVGETFTDYVSSLSPPLIDVSPSSMNHIFPLHRGDFLLALPVVNFIV